MSVEETFMDVLHGNFSHAWSRIQDGWNSIQPELKALVHKFADDEGKIVWAAGQQALQEVIAGKSVGEAAASAWSAIADQVPSKALQDLEDAIGIQKRAQ